MEKWLFFKDGKHAPDWNMACDEWLLNRIQDLACPLLRTYGWDRPSVTIGYFQKLVEVSVRDHSVVRRPTGGAIVVHDEDLTFTVVLPPSHAWCALRPLDRYRRIHERVAEIFRRRGQTVDLAPNDLAHLDSKARGTGGMKCFVGHSRFDVLVDGGKVVGGAQRLKKEGLLHQGSIQGPGIRERVAVEELRQAWEFFGAHLEEWKLTGEDSDGVKNLVDRKYATEEWMAGERLGKVEK